MSFAAFNVVHAPTGVECCASAYLTHCPADLDTEGGRAFQSLSPNPKHIQSFETQESLSEHGNPNGVPLLDSDPSDSLLGNGHSLRGAAKGGSPLSRMQQLPNLILTKANVLEVYYVRTVAVGATAGRENSSSGAEEGTGGRGRGGEEAEGEEGEGRVQSEGSKGGAQVMGSVAKAWLELACEYRLHGNVESMAVLSHRRDDGRQRRDAIILTFREAKFSVLEFDDTTHSLKASSLHAMEGPKWAHLRGGRMTFPRGPMVRADPLGRCAAVLLFHSQMVLLKAAQLGYGIGDDDFLIGPGGGVPTARVEGSYVVDLKTHGVKHVRDLTYLHGYNEPVVVLLDEKEPTWAGRAAVKKFTCGLTALTLNLGLKTHPVLWEDKDLPYDVYKLVAVPAPIGGVLIFSTNAIFYSSQTSKKVLALNKFAAVKEGYPEMQKVKDALNGMELDAAHAVWLTSQVALISTKSGDLLELFLDFDGREVKQLELERSKSAVLASSICTLGKNFVFLGSRLGDSLLVQYQAGTGIGSNSRMTKDEEDEGGDAEPEAKRLKRSLSEDSLGADELSLYNSFTSVAHSSRRKIFSFAVRDSLVNIGPIRDIAYGVRSRHDPSASGAAKQSNYELVACSGHGKNGSLSILQRSIRPDEVNKVELPGIRGIWTVHHEGDQPSAMHSAADEPFHAYLILSFDTRTMVFETGEELSDVSATVEYFATGRTIAAGNLFGRRRVAQVHPGGLRVLAGPALTQEAAAAHFPSSGRKEGEEPANERLPPQISAAVIKDPFVLLTMTDGTLRLAVGDPETCSVTVTAPFISEEAENPITACTLFHDRGKTPWLRRCCETEAQQFNVKVLHRLGLEGGPGGRLQRTSSRGRGGEASNRADRGEVFCIVCRKLGQLEIYELPGFNRIWVAMGIAMGRQILLDAGIRLGEVEKRVETDRDVGQLDENVDERKEEEAKKEVTITEICMETWGHPFGRPFILVILSDGRMFCYRAYSHEGVCELPVKGVSEGEKVEDMPEEAGSDEKMEDGNLTEGDKGSRRSDFGGLRFVRRPLNWVKSRGKGEEVSGDAGSSGQDEVFEKFVVFYNVGENGSKGVFVTGRQPVWIMACRERLRIHPQVCDGPIVAFAPLHLMNCRHSFVEATGEGHLKICQLPTLLNYDNDWPVHKVALRATPHLVSYSLEAKVYYLISSTTVQKSLAQVLAAPNEKEEEGRGREGEEGEEGELVSTDEFRLHVVVPPQEEAARSEWALELQNTFNTAENVLCMKTLSVKNKASGEMQPLLVIGTAYVQGEDVACKGRILMYETAPLSETVGASATLKEVFSKELKGPVTAVAALGGHVLAAAGRQLTLYGWSGADLEAVAFFDAPLYAVTLNTVKSFVLVGDVQKGVHFVQWREAGAQLALLAKAFEGAAAMATDFLVDGAALGLLVADCDRNLQIFQYAPKVAESFKGQRLIPRSQFHAGAQISRFLRLQMLPPPVEPSGRPPVNRYAVLCFTLDGGICQLAPILERTYRRLLSLQKCLVEAVAHTAGLNPHAFRQFRAAGAMPHLAAATVIDCELLAQFELLDTQRQIEVARKIGSEPEHIVEDLRDMAMATQFL